MNKGFQKALMLLHMALRSLYRNLVGFTTRGCTGVGLLRLTVGSGLKMLKLDRLFGGGPAALGSIRAIAGIAVVQGP